MILINLIYIRTYASSDDVRRSVADGDVENLYKAGIVAVMTSVG
jgi:hypothetical protein